MKVYINILLAVVLFNGVFTLPAKSPNDDAEVIDVPRRSHRGPVFNDDEEGDGGFHDFRGVIDTGSGYPFLQPVPHPLSFNLGFFDSFDDIFRRLRTHLWPVGLPSGDDSDEEGGFSFNLGKDKGNSTSTVKVVDGHKIEINDTVYGDENNVFKVRVVNIRPLESGEDAGDVATVDVAKKPADPVTSAPKFDNEDSDERREPLDHKNSNENEINRNIDDPEVKH